MTALSYGTTGVAVGQRVFGRTDRFAMSGLTAWQGLFGRAADIDQVATLDDPVAAFNPTERVKGKTITAIRP